MYEILLASLFGRQQVPESGLGAGLLVFGQGIEDGSGGRLANQLAVFLDGVGDTPIQGVVYFLFDVSLLWGFEPQGVIHLVDSGLCPVLISDARHLHVGEVAPGLTNVPVSKAKIFEIIVDVHKMCFVSLVGVVMGFGG